MLLEEHFNDELRRLVYTKDISLNNLALFIDNSYVKPVDSFKEIRKNDQNGKKKSQELHFVTTLLGKLSEYLIGKMLAERVLQAALKEGSIELLFSPKDEKGYEISDLLIRKKSILDKSIRYSNVVNDSDNESICRKIEVRSSFLHDPNLSNNHIIRYCNVLKKETETYKNDYFQCFFNKHGNELVSLISPLYSAFSNFLKELNEKETLSFKEFVRKNGLTFDDLPIITFSVSSYIDFDSFAKIKENSNVQQNLKNTGVNYEALALEKTLSPCFSFITIHHWLNQ